MKRKKIFVIDDDSYTLESFERYLADCREDFGLCLFDNPESALELIKANPSQVALIFLDQHLKKTGDQGHEVAGEIKSIAPNVEICMISGDDSKETFDLWIEAGIKRRLYKPFSGEEVLNLVRTSIVEQRHAEKVIQQVPVEGARKAEDREHSALSSLIGQSPQIVEIKDLIKIYANHNETVLLEGETGTGKELVARAIHEMSARSNESFVTIDCAQFKGQGQLLESKLFGHKKGSFTGASQNYSGAILGAHGGTIFLDELHQADLDDQARLLRLLQFKKVTPVGSSQEIPVDIRFICAIKGNPSELIQSGKLLTDLFYRISCFNISIPPLRSRGEDIEILAMHFVKKFNKDFGKKRVLSKEVLRKFKCHSFYGNVRELEKIIKNMIVTAKKDVILLSDLPSEFFEDHSHLNIIEEMDLVKLKKFHDLQIKKVILCALQESQQNVTKAAELLNVTRSTLKSKIRNLGIYECDHEERKGVLDSILKQLSVFTDLSKGRYN